MWQGVHKPVTMAQQASSVQVRALSEGAPRAEGLISEQKASTIVADASSTQLPDTQGNDKAKPGATSVQQLPVGNPEAEKRLPGSFSHSTPDSVIPYTVLVSAQSAWCSCA